MSSPRLSICIASMNRSQELASLVRQLCDQDSTCQVEIVIVDASKQPNNLVSELMSSRSGEYKWTGDPHGVDADFDHAVSLATGEYCWLLPDDDRLVENAVSNVLATVLGTSDLILVNTRVYDSDFNKVLRDSTLSKNVAERIEGEVTTKDLSVFSALLTYIGCVVVKRELWMDANREKYFGTEFVHVGVLLSQRKLNGLQVIVEPQIEICYGQGYWEQRYVQVWWRNWENLINGEISDRTEVPFWGVPSGWKKIGLTAYAKALRFVTNDEVRPRLQTDAVNARRRIAIWLIVIFPPWLLNISFWMVAKIVNRRSSPVVLYDLRRRRRVK